MRQRTALGRALPVNSPVVVLDDALACVDNTARIIDEMRDRTNKHLMISHQLSVLQHVTGFYYTRK